MAGDDPTVVFMAIRIVNTSGDRQVGRVRLDARVVEEQPESDQVLAEGARLASRYL